jgi:hypothetical protein
VTFEEKNGKTLLVVREIHPSNEALDAACAGTLEAFEQLEELLAALTAGPHPMSS